MSFYSTTPDTMPNIPPNLFGWDDLMRYLDILRLFAWLLRWLRALLPEQKKANAVEPQFTAPSLSRNEFGYINMNGAY